MKRHVYVVGERDDARSAARLMRDADVGFLAVCDPSGAAIGVLTDRDLAVRVCSEDAPPHEVLVGTVMTRGFLACRPEDSLHTAEGLIRQHRVMRLLVVDRAGRLVGVVSLSDLAQYEPASRLGSILKHVTERKYAPERP